MASSPSRPQRPHGPQRRRRISGSTYPQTALPYGRGASAGPTSSYSSSYSQRQGGLDNGQMWDPSRDISFYDYLCLGTAAPSSGSFTSAVYHDAREVGVTEPPPSLASASPMSMGVGLPQFMDSDDVFVSYTPISSSAQGSWASQGIRPPSSTYMDSRSEDTLMSDGRSGIYGSLDSIASSSPGTLASTSSDGYGFPSTSSSLTSSFSGSELMTGLKIPDEYFRFVDHDESQFPQFNDSFVHESPTESHSFVEPLEWMGPPQSDSNGGYWPSNGFQTQQELQNQSLAAEPFSGQIPWNSQNTQYDDIRSSAGAGVMAFEQDPGLPFHMFHLREGYINPSWPTPPEFGPEPVRPVEDEQVIKWKHLPQPDHHPLELSEKDIQETIESHSHVFSFDRGPPRGHKGRTRKLTPEERQQTMEVRKGGACWACYLSKTKCSPCSSGSPCEPCLRLSGKRRFCKLTCFNDSIESLDTFLMPDLLMSHFTQANVEAFIHKEASHWGTEKISVRMNWGCRRYLEASVVALVMRDELSEIGRNRQSITDGRGHTTQVERKSPPLGIPLGDMADMWRMYHRHVRDVVRYDLDDYVSTAYDSEVSKLPERLLAAICAWYQAGVSMNDENDLLQEALEIHITSCILERAFVLDETSRRHVQGHLREQYPPRPVPRCAQRQMKLIFFLVQRPRINRVLEKWGKLMRNGIGSTKNWVICFCVFVILTLIMDKTIAAAHRKCRSKTDFQRADAKEMWAGFEDLVRLMETNLFERCKEIFHSRYKTRKGGSERCNPIRDGVLALDGDAAEERTIRLIQELDSLARHLGRETPSSSASLHPSRVRYDDLGRLASIFLSEFAP